MIDTYVLPGDGIFPEGITEDPDGVTFYVGSAGQGTVFRGRLGEPELEVWQEGGRDGRTSALGMTVDAHGRLLVCGNETGFLYAYDTASGDLVAQRRVPADASLLNDICTVGEFAYVTDSIADVLWRVPVGHEIGEPERWIDFDDPAPQLYLNGIVAMPDNATLLVAAQGAEDLRRVDIASRTVETLDLRAAIDGMVLVGDRLYTCDNIGTSQDDIEMFVSELRVSADARHVILEHRWPRANHDSPTTIAYLGGRLLVVNSQFHPRHFGTSKPPFTVSAFTV
jgi:hypothetical protein